MRKTWTSRGIVFFVSAIVGTFAGLFLIIAIPQIWWVGGLVLILSLIYLLLALRSKEESPEEREKPIMDVTT